MSFFSELKRRNVFRVGIAYIVGGWLLLQLTDVLSELLDLPDVVGRIIVLVVAIGLPVALFFAWAFELTPEGVKRETEVDPNQSITPQTAKKLNSTIIVMLALAVAYLLYDKFTTTPDTPIMVEQPVAVIDEVSGSVPVTNETSESSKSIAVLPFTNRSPDANDAYFTDGVHDDLLTQLAKIDAFSVISRTSVMEYRDTAKNLRQIGEELGVANIMEGAVQRAGNRVRINVQLIDAGSDEHLWAEVYDRELTTENLFDIQSEIAKAIAGALQATLSDSEIAAVSNVPTDNVAAYELYLQGKRFSLGETEIGFGTAVELYKEALKLDPQFELAWVGLSHAYINNYWSYGGNPADRDKARNAIEKAKAIDPDFPELYLAEGSYYYWGLLDYDNALRYLDKAIALMPSNAEAHMWKGWASRRAGLWDQAIDSMQKAIKLNPRVVINLIETGQTLAYLDRFEEALELTEKAYKLEPDNYWPKSYLAVLEVVVNGDTDRADTLMVGGQHTNDIQFLTIYWQVQMLSGRFESALDIAQNWKQNWEMDVKAFSLRESYIALSLNALGRHEEAKQNARIALQRLAQMKRQGIDDFRVWTSELEAHAILGDTQQVSELAEKIMALKPADAVEDFNIRYRFAQSYAIAGMLDECIATLDTLLSGISFVSVPWLEHDPAFNSIRSAGEFIALLERHR
ncbi:MAG: tetratricopeptide repeat protein [Xanthomonadales bacterium]|nr:tetratricopeptide repeat protein [Xanthomonadales bacterium]